MKKQFTIILAGLMFAISGLSAQCAQQLAGQTWSVWSTCGTSNGFSSSTSLFSQSTPNQITLTNAFYFVLDCTNNTFTIPSQRRIALGPFTSGSGSIQYNVNGFNIINYTTTSTSGVTCTGTITNNPNNLPNCLAQLSNRQWSVQHNCNTNQLNSFESALVTPDTNDITRLSLSMVDSRIDFSSIINCSNNSQTVPNQSLGAFGLCSGNGNVVFNVNGSDRLNYSLTNSTGATCTATFTSNPNNTVNCTQSLASRQWSAETDCNGYHVFPTSVTTTSSPTNPEIFNLTMPYVTVTALADCSNNTISIPFQNDGLNQQNFPHTGTGSIQYGVNGTDKIIYNMLSANNAVCNITLTSNPNNTPSCIQSINTGVWTLRHNCNNTNGNANIPATFRTYPSNPYLVQASTSAGILRINAQTSCLNDTLNIPIQYTNLRTEPVSGIAVIRNGLGGAEEVRYQLVSSTGATCTVTLTESGRNAATCTQVLANRPWAYQATCANGNTFGMATVSQSNTVFSTLNVNLGAESHTALIDCLNNSLSSSDNTGRQGAGTIRYNYRGTDIIQYTLSSTPSNQCTYTLTSNPYNTVSCTQQLSSRSWTMRNSCTGNGNVPEQVTATSTPANPAWLKFSGSSSYNLLLDCANNTFSVPTFAGNSLQGVIEYNVNWADRMSYQSTDINGNVCSVTFTSNPYNTTLCAQDLSSRTWSIQDSCTTYGRVNFAPAMLSIDPNNPAILTFSSSLLGLTALVDCLNNTLSIPTQYYINSPGTGNLAFNSNGLDIITYNFINPQNQTCTVRLIGSPNNTVTCTQNLASQTWSIQHNCNRDTLSEFGQAIVSSHPDNSALLTFTTSGVTLTSIVDCASNSLIAPLQTTTTGFLDNSSATGNILYNVNGTDQISYLLSTSSGTCTATLTSNPYNTVSCTQNLANQTWSYQHDCNNNGNNTFFGQAVVSTDSTNPALLRINIGQFPNLEYMSLSTFIDCANNTLTAPAQLESINGSPYIHLTMPGTGTVQYNVNGVDRIAFSLTQWGMQTCSLTLTSNPYNTVTCARTIASQSWTSQVVNAPLNTNTFGNATVTQDNIDPNKLLIKFIEASSFADSFTVFVDCINNTVSYPKQINVDAGSGTLQLGTITEDKIILPIISRVSGAFYNGITLTSNPRSVVSCTESLSNRQWFMEHTCDNIPKIFSRVSTPLNVNNPALFTFELRDSFSMMFFKLHSLFDCNANTLITPFQVTDNGYYAGSANIQYNVNGTDRISFALTDLNSSTCTTTLTSNPYNTSSCTRTLGNRPWDFQQDCPFTGSASGQATVSEIPSNPGLLKFDLYQSFSVFYAYIDCNNNLLSVPNQIHLPSSQTGQGNISYNVNGLDRIALLTYDNGNICTITMTSNPNNIINCASLLTSQNYSATVDQNGSITTQSGSIIASNNNPGDINISLPGIRASLNATVNCSNSSFSFSNQNVSVTTVNGSGNFSFSQNGINTVTLTLSNGYRITLTNAVANNPTCVQQICSRPWNIVENTNGTLVNYVATVTQTGQLNTVELRYGTRNIVLNVDCATDSLFMPTQLIDGNLYDGNGRFVLGANGRDSMFLNVLLKSGFSLSFGRPTVVAIEEPTISSAKVFSTDNNQIVIQLENGSTDNFSFVCYDVLGRCIMRKDNLSGETSSVPLTNQKQVLFWSIEREGRVLHSGKLLH